MNECELCNSKVFRIKNKLKQFKILECVECGLLHQSPVPSPQELFKIYNDGKWINRPYFRNCKVDYQADDKINMFQWGIKRLESLQSDKGELLDVGCATGVFLNIAKNQGWNVTGIECSRHFCEYARKEFKINIIQGMVENIELPSQKYQVITLWDVLEHFSSPIKVLSKLIKSLSSNGLLLIFTPNSNSLVRKMAPILDFLSQPCQKIFSEMVFSPLHIYYFNVININYLLKLNNIKLLEVRQMPMSPNRAGHGNSLQRFLLKSIDGIGKCLNKSYRFVVIAQKTH